MFLLRYPAILSAWTDGSLGKIQGFLVNVPVLCMTLASLAAGVARQVKNDLGTIGKESLAL